MKKLAFITYEFPPEMATGGIGSYFFHLSNLLSKHNFEIHVFSATLIKENAQSINRAYCINHLIYARSNDEFRENVLPVFTKIHKDVGFDLMESPEVGACALEIKKSFPQIPLIVKLHTPGVCITKVSRTYQPLNQKLRFVLGALLKGRIDLGYWAQKDKNREADVEYLICQMANKVLSPSIALRDWLVKYWDLDEHLVEVIPNPYSFDNTIVPDTSNNREKIILFVGKLTVLKGMVSFTKAIPNVLKKHPDYKIKLVGRDEYDGFLCSSIKDYMIRHLGKYSSQVEFLGVLDRSSVDCLYKRATLAVFPSLWENYPTVVMEAMSMGCVVVASNVGGFPEIIENGINGLLFNPLKYKEIAKSIKTVIKEDELRIKLRANAAKTIEIMQKSTFTNKIVSIYL